MKEVFFVWGLNVLRLPRHPKFRFFFFFFIGVGEFIDCQTVF